MQSTIESAKLLATWLAEIRASPIVLRADGSPDANANMHIFPVSAAVHAGASTVELSWFLEDAYRLRCGRERRNTWFYAWFDELSGTLRTSVAAASDPTELPFNCQLQVVDSPDRVAEEACSSPYLEGLLWEEFERAPLPGGTELEPPAYQLTVFARALTAL